MHIYLGLRVCLPPYRLAVCSGVCECCLCVFVQICWCVQQWAMSGARARFGKAAPNAAMGAIGIRQGLEATWVGAEQRRKE